MLALRRASPRDRRASSPDTSIGKRSTFIDLRTSAGAEVFRELVRGVDIVVQSYRPGALDALGFGPDAVAALSPGIIYVSLSAYSHTGPWRDRRGYDTLVQTASGIALSEADALASPTPRHVPASALDFATGYLAAAAAMSALAARYDDDRARHVRCSLAQTREWLESLGRVDGAGAVARHNDDEIARGLPTISGGRPDHLHASGGHLSATPAHFAHGPVTPGSDRPVWLQPRWSPSCRMRSVVVGVCVCGFRGRRVRGSSLPI